MSGLVSPDDELKYTRRLFLQHTAAATATAAAFYSIAMKTDAMAQVAGFAGGRDAGDGMPYPYHMPPN